VAAYSAAIVFYDLLEDPWEQDSLLDGRTISDDTRTHYESLDNSLRELLGLD
jgi:hypothetical protein